jgi:methyl coenzyme M reductase alpha subunit
MRAKAAAGDAIWQTCRVTTNVSGRRYAGTALRWARSRSISFIFRSVIG